MNKTVFSCWYFCFIWKGRKDGRMPSAASLKIKLLIDKSSRRLLVLLVRTGMFEQQPGRGFLRQKVRGHPPLRGHKRLQRSHPADVRRPPTPPWPTYPRPHHILHTSRDPRGCRAGLTGCEFATRKLSGLASVCRVRLVRSASTVGSA